MQIQQNLTLEQQAIIDIEDAFDYRIWFTSMHLLLPNFWEKLEFKNFDISHYIFVCLLNDLFKNKCPKYQHQCVNELSI